jgi:hypothetical protein
VAGRWKLRLSRVLGALPGNAGVAPCGLVLLALVRVRVILVEVPAAADGFVVVLVLEVAWTEQRRFLCPVGLTDGSAEDILLRLLGIHVAADALPELAILGFLPLPGATGEVEIPAAFGVFLFRLFVRAVVLIHRHERTTASCWSLSAERTSPFTGD